MLSDSAVLAKLSGTTEGFMPLLAAPNLPILRVGTPCHPSVYQLCGIQRSMTGYAATFVTDMPPNRVRSDMICNLQCNTYSAVTVPSSCQAECTTCMVVAAYATQ